MISTLKFGNDSSLSLELMDEALVANCGVPRGTPLAHVAEAVDDALARPLAFPPLAQAAVPGDKVVLACDRDVPQGATLVARVVATLLVAGIAPEDITLLRTLAEADADSPDLLEELPDEIRQVIGRELHDPGRRESLSYLGATANAEPIYLNRTIYDADLVISIGCLRHSESLGYYGVGSVIFPGFSDAASIERYRSPRTLRGAQHVRLRAQSDEVSWRLGAQFTLQAVPGRGSEVLHVLAGDSQAVAAEGDRLCNEAWSCDVPRRAGLVIATIEGKGAEQTWENVGRALAAAAQAVDTEGAVVLCTDLAERPGPAMQQIAGAEDLDDVLRDLEKHCPADALAAAELLHALERGKVYLISRLADELVEDLGILPVAPGQLSRLAARYESCIVLANAHRALARPRGERAPEPVARRKLRR